MTEETLDIDFFDSEEDRVRYLCQGMQVRLREHILMMGWTQKDQGQWTKAFQALVREHGMDAVNSRLQQFIELKIDRPRVGNGTEFRKHWKWIGEEIEKRRVKINVPLLDKTGEAILKELREYPWPELAMSQLPAVVAQSVVNYKEFSFKLKTCLDKKLNAACIELLYELGDVQTGLTNHFLLAHKSLVGWKEWSGNIEHQTWKATHALVQKRLQAVLVRWAGEDDGTWAKILAMAQSQKAG